MTTNQLPPPATIRRSMKMSLALMILGLVMAIVPDLRMPGVVLALVFGGLWLLGRRNLKRAEEAIARDRVDAPPMAGGDRMFEVLAMLDVPIDMTPTDPTNALLSGAAKAGLYRGHTQLMAGNDSEALSTLHGVAEGGHGRVSAAAHYLIGQSHARRGRREEAMASYRSALSAAPDYRLASEALEVDA